MPAQYVQWMGAVPRGDLGTSPATARPVSAVIAEALPLSWHWAASPLFQLRDRRDDRWSRVFRAGSPRGDTTVTVLSTISLRRARQFLAGIGAVVLATSGASAVGVPFWLRLLTFGGIAY
ncbi:MAG: hypothetical protein IPP90_20880 [Gemmatimonadaceae bacterium]|nr:hypothetical protein [Gemmatimonadaceae bacterium]